MSSIYFTYSAITPFTTARSTDVNTRFQQVEAGFDMLPTPTLIKENRVTFVTAAGTGNALTVTLPHAPSAYTAGLNIRIKLSASNTSTATLNVNGLGAVALKRADGTDLQTGDLTSGNVVDVVHDGTNFRLMRESFVASDVTNATILAALGGNQVTNAMLRQSAGLSLVGRSANTTGDVADITAASDHQVLRRSGTSVGFGAIDLSQSAAVTGTLPVARGGTGGTLPVANGGTGVTTSTGSVNVVLSNAPTIASPTISAPSITGVAQFPGGASAYVKMGADTNLSNYAHIDLINSTSPAGFKVRIDTGADLCAFLLTGTVFHTETTASAANLYQSSSGTGIARSTSSAKYKRDVEDADMVYARKILDVRPIWYRSTASLDNPSWGYFGFLAEEVHAAGLVQLVHYAFQEDQLEEVQTAPAKEAVPAKLDPETGEIIEPEQPATPAQFEKRPKEGEVKRPDGIQYERFVVLQQMLIKELFQRIEALEARVV